MTNRRPGSARRGLGDRGEELAAQALLEAGLTLRERNWRCAAGELDIVAMEEGPDFTQDGRLVPWLVAVEVRTRRGTRFGTALQSVTPRKQRKLREVAEHYVKQSGWTGPWRIDVVAVQMDRRGRLIAIDHLRHAVTAS